MIKEDTLNIEIDIFNNFLRSLICVYMLYVRDIEAVMSLYHQLVYKRGDEAHYLFGVIIFFYLSSSLFILSETTASSLFVILPASNIVFERFEVSRKKGFDKKGTIMKKVLAAAVATALVTQGVWAEAEMTVRVASSEILENSQLQYGLGYGFTSYHNNGFAWSSETFLDYAQLEDTNVIGFGTALKLGYSMFSNDLYLYGLGGLLVQDVGDGAYGFGFGAGVNYRFAEHFSVGAEYQQYSMQELTVDYDYTQASGFVRVLW